MSSLDEEQYSKTLNAPHRAQFGYVLARKCAVKKSDGTTILHYS